LELIERMALKGFHNILSFFRMNFCQSFKILFKFIIWVATICYRNHEIVKVFVNWVKLIG
jgi:hypothetical protein